MSTTDEQDDGFGFVTDLIKETEDVLSKCKAPNGKDAQAARTALEKIKSTVERLRGEAEGDTEDDGDDDAREARLTAADEKALSRAIDTLTRAIERLGGGKLTFVFEDDETNEED